MADNLIWKWVGRASTLVFGIGIGIGLWHDYDKFPIYSRVLVVVGTVGLIAFAIYHRKQIVDWVKVSPPTGSTTHNLVNAPTGVAAPGMSGGSIDGNMTVFGHNPAWPPVDPIPRRSATVESLNELRTRLLVLSQELIELSAATEGLVGAVGGELRAAGRHIFVTKYSANVNIAYSEAHERGYPDQILPMFVTTLAGPSPIGQIGQRLALVASRIDPAQDAAS